AMDRLFLIKAIESHTYRNTAKGRDVTVIREASASPRTLTPNASRTPSPNAPEQSARTTPRTHCIPTVYPGAANGAAAPSQEKSESRLPHGWSAPILAPGDEDAPIPGFEDMDMNR
ncbi:hypothetical protein, partial [Sphingomonas sp. ID0503]|uniref:hypothetical protein n=1 Tax=Sphingomonas sp. ID0503 TaxID=3399691 RepID=UPI003AFAED04